MLEAINNKDFDQLGKFIEMLLYKNTMCKELALNLPINLQSETLITIVSSRLFEELQKQ